MSASKCLFGFRLKRFRKQNNTKTTTNNTPLEGPAAELSKCPPLPSSSICISKSTTAQNTPSSLSPHRDLPESNTWTHDSDSELGPTPPPPSPPPPASYTPSYSHVQPQQPQQQLRPQPNHSFLRFHSAIAPRRCIKETDLPPSPRAILRLIRSDENRFNAFDKRMFERNSDFGLHDEDELAVQLDEPPATTLISTSASKLLNGCCSRNDLGLDKTNVQLWSNTATQPEFIPIMSSSKSSLNLKRTPLS